MSDSGRTAPRAADGAAMEAIVVAEAELPTRFGSFRAVVLRVGVTGADCLVAVRGDVGAADAPLVRLHSECLTGDVFGSLRCDCGEQLGSALARIAAEGTGCVVYLDQEGRGIGLVNKIRAYALQDGGADTVDANVELGLPVDGREYGSAAAALRALGVRRVRLLTNNPRKCRGLEERGVEVVERLPLPVDRTPYNDRYLRTKAARMGHLIPTDGEVGGPDGDAAALISGPPSPAPDGTRPSVTVHYAQTLDGRIATRTGHSQWLGCDDSLRLAHRLRASHDAVAVGVGTVLADDPRLTVRRVPGPSPRRVVLDTTLRLPLDCHLLSDGCAPTTVATTARAAADRVAAVRERGAEVVVVPEDEGLVDIGELLRRLRERGVRSILVEGGSGVITTVLRRRLADRLVVCVAPKLMGSGIDAVGDLAVHRLQEAVTFERSTFAVLGDDLIFEGVVRGGVAAVA